MAFYRSEVVKLANSWVGKNEADGSFKTIIDEYNKLGAENLPRKTKMLYEWAWCACTWSALAIKLNYTKIMPIEISCFYLIEEAKKMGCWTESDSYVPQPGDGVLYDWDDNGVGENKGAPEHVGVVVNVNEKAGTFVVVEGNYSNAVKKRTMKINGRYIRGFITPKYDVEPVVAKPAATTQQTQITKPATSTTETQTTTKKVTATAYAKGKDADLAGTYVATTDVYMRNDAGTNKKPLVIVPKGTKVKNYGYYSDYNGVRWLFIQVTIKGVVYSGFSSSKYYTKQ